MRTGLTHAPNRYGVMATSSGGNTIGGEGPSSHNVISGNDIAGVYLEVSSNNNVVAGNYIGIDASAEHTLGNGTGIVLKHSNANTIGGLVPGAANILSGNDAFGIELIAAAKNNDVMGNYVGTDPESSVLASTDFGNGQHGDLPARPGQPQHDRRHHAGGRQRSQQQRRCGHGERSGIISTAPSRTSCRGTSLGSIRMERTPPTSSVTHRSG